MCQALEHSEPGQLAAVARYALDQSNRTSGDLLALRLELLSTAGELTLAQARIVELEEIVMRQNAIISKGRAQCR